MDKFDLPIIVRVNRFYQSLYILGVVGSLWLMIAAWFSLHSVNLMLCPGAFFLLFFYAFLLSRSRIEIDLDSIVIVAPHGIYKLNWSEIDRIESNGAAFALFGKDKYLSMNLSMTGAGVREFYEFINAIIIERNIQVKPLSSVWLTQKNTRISGFGFRI